MLVQKYKKMLFMQEEAGSSVCKKRQRTCLQYMARTTGSGVKAFFLFV